MEENVIMEENKKSEKSEKPDNLQLTLDIANKQRNNKFLDDLLKIVKKFCRYVYNILLPNIPVFLQHYASTIDSGKRDVFRQQIIMDDHSNVYNDLSAETRRLLVNSVTAKINDYIREDGRIYYLSPDDMRFEEFKLRVGLFQAIKYENGKFYVNINDKLIGPLYSSYKTLDSFILLLLYHSHVEIKESLYFTIEHIDLDEIDYYLKQPQFRLRITIPIQYITQAIEILDTQTDTTSKLLIKKYYELININDTTKRINMEDDADINDDEDDEDDIDED